MAFSVHKIASKWEYNIKKDLREVGWVVYGLDRCGSGWEQVAGSCECVDEPSGSIKYWENLQ
jgi:hypothetical protein